MNLEILSQFGYPCVLTISAIGSALGTGIAGLAAVGAWKKCFVQERNAPFILTTFAGAPLTQTIYGYILMDTIFVASQNLSGAQTASPAHAALLAAGIFGGVAMGLSSYMQGKAGAAAADALAETGKGFGNFIMVLGIIESVALFVMIFLMVTLNKLG